MSSRIDFHNALKEITPNVYFQPPENIKIKYPCFVYSQTIPDVIKADSKNYIVTKCYDVTYIDSDPDNDHQEKVYDSFAMVQAKRYFTTSGLYHYNYYIYY